MGLKRWIRGIFAGSAEDAQAQWTPGRSGALMPTLSGSTVSAERALTLPAYYAALRVISEDVAKLPLKVYRREDRAKILEPEHDLYQLLHDLPHPEITSMVFRETMQWWAMSWGNSIAIIDIPGAPTKLFPVHPSRVDILESETGAPMYRVRYDAGNFQVFGATHVIHIRGLGDHLKGYSIARLAAESIGLGLATQDFGSAFFGKGASLGGVLTTPASLKDTELERLRTSWTEFYSGAQNAGKVAILEEGLKYERIGIPPEEAQFLESRKFQVTEIARWFRLPPHKIQDLERATFSNIEQQSIEYVQDTLLPWIVRWEQELRRKLFLNRGDDEHFAEFSMDGILRGDQTARQSFYTSMFNIGVLSANDIREKENLNPIDCGDVYYRPMNMVRADEDPEEAPPPDPEAPPAEELPAEAEPPDDPPAPPEDQGESARSALWPVFLEAAERVAGRDSTIALSGMRKCGENRARYEAHVDEALGAATYSGDAMDWFGPGLSALASLKAPGAEIPEAVIWDHRAGVREELLQLKDMEGAKAYEAGAEVRAEFLANDMMKMEAKLAAKAAALLAVGALALTACGGGSTPAATTAGGVQLVQAGKFTVCSDIPYEPFEFQKDGQIVGFDIDIATEVAKDLKAELSVVDSSFEAIETGTALTGCDAAISSLSITEPRKAVMDFSTPYLNDDLTLVASEASGITNLDDAKGKKVGVQQATTGAQYAKDKGIDAQQFEDTGLLVQALKAGTIDAALGNQSVLGYAIKDDSKFKRVENFTTGEQLGIAVKKGNTPMLEQVNATLKRLTDDGSLKKFETTWFGEATK